jgi:hypothetical protein
MISGPLLVIKLKKKSFLFFLVGTQRDPEKPYGEVFYLILRSCTISDKETFERIGLLVL